MNRNLSKLVLQLTLSISGSASANVLGLFPAGPGCKSAAMETAGDCTEAQTLLYNPAVMSEIDRGFSGEVGAARLQYGYEHPRFDPVHVNLFTPMFSEGWRGTFADEVASWGFAVMPSSSADLSIKGLPRRVGGSQESLNIKAQKRQFHLAFGGSYKFEGIGANAGLSVIYSYDSRSLKGASVTNPGSNLVDMKASGHFFRPVIGGTWKTEIMSAGASYILPVTKKFSGKTKLATETAPFDTEQVDYDPGVVLTSARTKISDFALSVNFNRLFGAKGATVQRDGLNRTTHTADLKDVNHIGARLGYQSQSYGDFSFAAAYLDSYWGGGSYYTDVDGFSHHEIGHIFGQFNAIPVRNQSLTWRQTFGSWKTHAALFRSAGSTTVGPRGDNPGYYQIEFVSVTCGLRASL